jgi:hypothetical protein
MRDAGERDRFNGAMADAPANVKRFIIWRATPCRCPSVFDTHLAGPRHRITPKLTTRITTQVLVADPDGEQYFAGRPERCNGMLSGRTELVRFTAGEGAAGDCQPMARTLAVQWLLCFHDDEIRCLHDTSK